MPAAPVPGSAGPDRSGGVGNRAARRRRLGRHRRAAGDHQAGDVPSGGPRHRPDRTPRAGRAGTRAGSRAGPAACGSSHAHHRPLARWPARHCGNWSSSPTPSPTPPRPAIEAAVQAAGLLDAWVGPRGEIDGHDVFADRHHAHRDRRPFTGRGAGRGTGRRRPRSGRGSRGRAAAARRSCVRRPTPRRRPGGDRGRRQLADGRRHWDLAEGPRRAHRGLGPPARPGSSGVVPCRPGSASSTRPSPRSTWSCPAWPRDGTLIATERAARPPHDELDAAILALTRAESDRDAADAVVRQRLETVDRPGAGGRQHAPRAHEPGRRARHADRARSPAAARRGRTSVRRTGAGLARRPRGVPRRTRQRRGPGRARHAVRRDRRAACGRSRRGRGEHSGWPRCSTRSTARCSPSIARCWPRSRSCAAGFASCAARLRQPAARSPRSPGGSASSAPAAPPTPRSGTPPRPAGTLHRCGSGISPPACSPPTAGWPTWSASTPILAASDGVRAALDAARIVAAAWPAMPHAPTNLGDALHRLSESVHAARTALSARADLDLETDEDVQMFIAIVDGVRVGAAELLDILPLRGRARPQRDHRAGTRAVRPDPDRRHPPPPGCPDPAGQRTRRRDERAAGAGAHRVEGRRAAGLAGVARTCPTGTKTARDLLLKDPVRLTDADRESLHWFFRDRIEQAKADDTATSWEQQLAQVFDYTAWHQFIVKIDRGERRGLAAADQEAARRALRRGEGDRSAPTAVRRGGRALPGRTGGTPRHPARRGLRRGGQHQPRAGLRAAVGARTRSGAHLRPRVVHVPELSGIGIHQLITGNDGDDAVTTARFTWDGHDLLPGGSAFQDTP